PFAEPLSSEPVKHKNIRNPGESRVIGYYSRKPGLLILFVYSKRQRIINRKPYSLFRPSRSPVGRAQKCVDYIDVYSRLISAYQILSFLPFVSHNKFLLNL